jgi:hypothetical protein
MRVLLAEDDASMRLLLEGVVRAGTTSSPRPTARGCRELGVGSPGSRVERAELKGVWWEWLRILNTFPSAFLHLSTPDP